MADIANGIDAVLVGKKQVGKGIKATTDAAKKYRRVTAMFNAAAESFASNEIRESQQVADLRLAGHRVDGALNGEMSPSSYDDFIESIFRRNFTAGPTTGALTTIAATVNGFTDSANGWITAGFKIGMIVRPSGFAGAAAVHNGQNFFVTNVTANLLSCSALNDDTIVAEAEGANVTVAAPGKITYVPLTTHTQDWFTFEYWDNKITMYRSFTDCMVGKMDLKIPPAAMTTCDFTVLGIEAEEPQGAMYFVSPEAQDVTGNFSGSTAKLAVNGVLTVCTNMEMSLDATLNGVPVVGSKYIGNISRGKVTGTGVYSVFLEDKTYLEYFRKETEIPISYAMAVSEAKDADAMSFTMPRIKHTSATDSDGEESKIVTCNFQMLERVDGNEAYEATTIMVQDTTL